MITTRLIVRYVPLPPEKEPAYRAALRQIRRLTMHEPETIISQFLREKFIDLLSALPDSFFDLTVDQRRTGFLAIQHLVINGVHDIDVLTKTIETSIPELQIKSE